jgi:hypothetical protein
MRIALGMLGCLGVFCLTWLAMPLVAQEKGKASKEAKALGADFVYPGAEKLTTAANPALEGPGIFSVKYTTADGSGKVVAWYRKKLGIQAVPFCHINKEDPDARQIPAGDTVCRHG